MLVTTETPPPPGPSPSFSLGEAWPGPPALCVALGTHSPLWVSVPELKSRWGS